ncbi:MAG: DUF4321 domain-containing protein [Ruminococcus sp.]|nr:DUF4321 domain-containing protein [Ruminococcus sp.]
MKNFKKTFAFIFFVLAGIIIGAFIAYVCAGKNYVGWLAWGKELGIQNFNLDLYVIRFSFGLMFNATISQIFTIPLSLVIYAKTCKSL